MWGELWKPRDISGSWGGRAGTEGQRGEGRKQGKELKITRCQRSFLPSYTFAVWTSNINLNINHFEKKHTYANVFPVKHLSPRSW